MQRETRVAGEAGHTRETRKVTDAGQAAVVGDRLAVDEERVRALRRRDTCFAAVSLLGATRAGAHRPSYRWAAPRPGVLGPCDGFGDRAGASFGPIVQLRNPGGPVSLQWGPIQPVSQLGSQQLASGRLLTNADGSVTIWIAPTLPAGAPATNWLPTPSSAYYASIYGVSVPTQIRPMIRTYYPTPGSDTQASILPPPPHLMGATCVLPALQKVG